MKTKAPASWIITSLAFLAAFLVYLFNLEHRFMITTPIIGLPVNLQLTPLFFTILLTFIFTYSRLYHKSLKQSFALIFPIAIFWQLCFFVIGMIASDPWSGSKAVFALYSQAYITLFISSCLIIIYKMRRYLTGSERPLFIIPGSTLIIYMIWRILSTRSYIYLVLIPVACLVIILLLRLWRFIESRNIPRKELYFVLFIFFLAFAIRSAWGIRLISLAGENFYYASDDGITYGPHAEDWVNGIDHSPLGTFGGFGYWVFLGLIYRVFGNANYYAAVFAQSFLGALVPVFVYAIAKRITAPVVAVVSGILASLIMSNVFVSVVTGMESLFIPLMFFALFLLVKYTENGKIIKLLYPFYIGTVIGAATIVRTEPILFLLVIAICFALFSRGRFSKIQVLKLNTAILLGFLLVLLTFCMRNYIRQGKFDFKSKSAEISFALVPGPGMDQTKALSNMGFNPFQEGNKLNSLKVFRDQPGRVSSLLLTGMAKKGVHYLFVPNFGEMDFLTLLNPSGVSTIYRLPLYCKLYIYLLILLGLVKLLYSRKAILEKNIIFGFMLYTTVIYSIIWTANARYRAVLEPLFVILFANGIYFIVIKCKEALIQRK